MCPKPFFSWHFQLYFQSATKNCSSFFGRFFPVSSCKPNLPAVPDQYSDSAIYGDCCFYSRCCIQKPSRSLPDPNFYELDHKILCSITDAFFILQKRKIDYVEVLIWESRECWRSTWRERCSSPLAPGDRSQKEHTGIYFPFSFLLFCSVKKSTCTDALYALTMGFNIQQKNNCSPVAFSQHLLTPLFHLFTALGAVTGWAGLSHPGLNSTFRSPEGTGVSLAAGASLSLWGKAAQHYSAGWRAVEGRNLCREERALLWYPGAKV